MRKRKGGGCCIEMGDERKGEEGGEKKWMRKRGVRGGRRGEIIK